MNLSPYRNDPAAVVLDEPDWEAKYWSAAAERDRWQDRVFVLEGQLEGSAAKLAERGAGDVCTAPACSSPKAKLTDLPLCRVHLESAYYDMWATWRDDWKHYPQRVPDAIAEELGASERPWVVYYIAMGDRVKIGRTTDLRKRLRSLHALPDQLLAVEPGVVIDGVDRELERHREFAHLRVPRTELFERDEHLNRHIEQVRSTFGDPSALLD